MASRKAQVIKQIRERDDAVQGFSLALRQFLSRELRRITRDLQSQDKDTKTRAIDAARILGGIRENLVEAGLPDLLSQINELYAKELLRLDESLSKYARGTEIFTAADVELVQALATFDFEQFANQIDVSVDEFRGSVMRSVIGGQPIETSALIDTLSDRAERYASTNLNTSLSGFFRSMTLNRTESIGLDLFYYLGPKDDDVIRPFCEERVGKVFTRAEVETWDNGQGLDAAIFLGGYNCRHQLVAVSEEEARNLYGYKGS